MLRPACPECGATVSIDVDDLNYFSQFYCDACGLLLEVAEEAPLRLQVVSEDPDPSAEEADDVDEEDV